MSSPRQPATLDQNFAAPTGSDPGAFAMVVIIGITIFAIIFFFFVSAVE
jgi:hypothetical protein